MWRHTWGVNLKKNKLYKYKYCLILDLIYYIVSEGLWATKAILVISFHIFHIFMCYSFRCPPNFHHPFHSILSLTLAFFFFFHISLAPNYSFTTMILYFLLCLKFLFLIFHLDNSNDVLVDCLSYCCFSYFYVFGEFFLIFLYPI